MSRQDFGQPLSSLVMQPGRTLVLKQDGSASGQIQYRCDAQSAHTLAPRVGSPHPDNAQLQCYNVSITVLENSIAEISCEYLGIFSDPTTYQIEFLVNVGEEPIETHQNFVAKIGGQPGSPLNKAKFDTETGEFLGFPADAPDDLGGVRGYLNPACTVRISWFTRNASMGLYSLGRIASPPTVIPRPPDSRNWLKTNWSRRDFGLIYQITEEYTASGQKGWNRLIYG